MLFSQWTDILYTPHIDHFVTQSLQVAAEQPFQESQRSMPLTLTVGTQPQGLGGRSSILHPSVQPLMARDAALKLMISGWGMAASSASAVDLRKVTKITKILRHKDKASESLH